MYKLCKTEQSAQRQRQLEEGLLNAMKTKRYEEITISDLCGQMGIPRKSFYRYFTGKDGALQALIDHTLLDFEQQTGILSGRSVGDVRQDLLQFFEFWRDQKALLDAMERSGLSGVLVQRALTQSRSDYVAPYYMAVHDPSVAPHDAIAFSICGLMYLMTRWHRCGYRESVEEMANTAAALLTRPLVQV